MTSFFLFVCSLAGAFSSLPFKIEGHTPSILNNKTIYLVVQDNYSNTRTKFIDSVIVKSNYFEFNGIIEKPAEWAFIYTKDKHYLAYFVVEAGVNKMLIGEVAKNSPTFKNKLSNTTILNSLSNKIIKEIDSLRSEYYLKKGKPSPLNKNVIELDKYAIKEMRTEELRIIRSNPNCYYSLIHLYSLLKLTLSEPTEINNAFDELGSDLQNSELGKELRAKIEAAKVVLIGKKVRYFDAKTNANLTFTSDSLNGKPYLLAFGATWCQPCKKNIPILIKLYDKYRKKGFEIVYVNLDDNEKLWKQQIKQYKMEWINISELKKWQESKIVQDFNIQAIPFYLIIDKNSIVTYNSFQLKDLNFEKMETYILESLRN